MYLNHIRWCKSTFICTMPCIFGNLLTYFALRLSLSGSKTFSYKQIEKAKRTSYNVCSFCSKIIVLCASFSFMYNYVILMAD